jgi:hypothetical protein
VRDWNVQFDTLYDIREAGCRDGFLVLFGIALTLASAIAWIRNRTSDRAPPGPSGWPQFALGQGPPGWPKFALSFFAVWTFVAFGATWAQYWNLLRGVRTGQAQVLEGTVTEFQPAPTYKGTERFRLGDQEFSYSRVATSQGFHTLAADGGPIANGAHVRILHIDNHILRLQLGRTSVTNVSDRTAARKSLAGAQQ